MRNILSISRRTDIPAFYSEWLMGRIRAGALGYVNPFGGRKYSISLARESVGFIVFWSKNYAPLLKHLDQLDAAGYQFCFQFTITGHPEILEANVPEWKASVEVAHLLAARYSPDHVLWRFDPIVFSSVTPPGEVMDRFSVISEAISGAVSRCYFSFVDYYGKVRRSFENIYEKTGMVFSVNREDEEKFLNDVGKPPQAFLFDSSVADKKKFVGLMAETAAMHGISLYSCCDENYTDSENDILIRKASCVDSKLIESLTSGQVSASPRPTRKDCGCAASIDIGIYDTCPHGCSYCYANINKDIAYENYEALSAQTGSYALTRKYALKDFPPLAPSERELF